MNVKANTILTLLCMIVLAVLFLYQKQIIQMDSIANVYKDDVADQDEQIQDVHTRVAELSAILEETKQLSAQKNKELYMKINSIDAAINSKSKRWVQIKRVRTIVKETIAKSRYSAKMNIVALTRYASAVVDFSNEYDVPIPLILAVTRQESAFNPKAVSHAGAQGLMQLMPGTARECAGDIGKRYSNVFHVGTNVQFGTFYLRKMLTRFNEDTELAVKAYNAGPNYVSKVLAKIYRNYPAETIDYSKKVLQYLEEYKTSYN
jgi:soluble lytic murein transglycosylase-like protein